MSEKYNVLGREFESYLDAVAFKDKVEALIIEIKNLNLNYDIEDLDMPIQINYFDSDIKVEEPFIRRSYTG